MRKIGLVLSGGGARGFAHLGVLQALDELGIKISSIAGVSAGAITGTLYAAGYAPRKIFELIKGQNFYKMPGFQFSRTGLFSLKNIELVLAQLIKENNFEHLQIPLFIGATNLSEGKAEIFSTGSLFDKVLASASVPALFVPVLIDGKYYVDGGVTNNFPVESLKDKCDVVIGSHVNKLYDGHHIDINRIQIVEHCFHLAIASKVYAQAMLCDVYIEPELIGFGMFDLKQAETVFEKGYTAAMEQKEKLLSLTPLHQIKGEA
jgi:NTE family protein